MPPSHWGLHQLCGVQLWLCGMDNTHSRVGSASGGSWHLASGWCAQRANLGIWAWWEFLGKMHHVLFGGGYVEPCSVQSLDVYFPPVVGSPTHWWLMRKPRLKTIPGTSFSFYDCAHLCFHCLHISCSWVLFCVSPTLGPVPHQTQCPWAQYYIFFSLKFHNPPKKGKRNLEHINTEKSLNHKGKKKRTEEL